MSLQTYLSDVSAIVIGGLILKAIDVVLKYSINKKK